MSFSKILNPKKIINFKKFITMKKTIFALSIIGAMSFVNAQQPNLGIPQPTPNPHPGFTMISSNCKQIKLGFVNITTGSETWVDGNGNSMSVPCSDGDRWHWFWE